MRFRHAAQCLGFVAAALLLTSSAGADEPFAVEVIDAPRNVPLGLSANVVVRIVNTSGTSQPTAFLHAERKLKVVDGPPAAMRCLASSPFEGPRTFHHKALVADLVANRRAEVPAGWTTETGENFLPPEPGEYTVVFTFSMTAGTETRLGEPEDNWVGEVSSAPVKVRVVEPQGEDAEAFEWYSATVRADFCCSRARRFVSAFGMPPQRVERVDLLRQFPDSVYTADYVLRHLLQIRLSVSPDYIIPRTLDRDVDDLNGRVPCLPPERCPEGGERYLRGADYIGWKLGWCERILEHHPDAHFADRVRFVKAIYSHQLGNRRESKAALEDLTEYGRPYAAEKAGALLSAMKAKKMFEEKEK